MLKLGNLPIPKILHQIWIGPQPPPTEWMDTWRLKYVNEHSGWKYMLWREADIAAVLPVHVRDAFSVLPQWCLKADIARYAILEKHGGVYIDADMVWLGHHDLESVVRDRGVLLALENLPQLGYGSDERIGNSVIGIVPGHPLMSMLLTDISDGFASLVEYLGAESPFLHEFRIGYRLTSPPAITHSYKSSGLHMSNLIPSNCFYPVPWWCGQSLSKTVSDTAAEFPAAIATHYGYSTNRLGGERPNACSMVKKQTAQVEQESTQQVA